MPACGRWELYRPSGSPIAASDVVPLSLKTKITSANLFGESSLLVMTSWRTHAPNFGLFMSIRQRYFRFGFARKDRAFGARSAVRSIPSVLYNFG